jgi:hypothetical protein
MRAGKRWCDVSACMQAAVTVAVQCLDHVQVAVRAHHAVPVCVWHQSADYA